MMPGEGTFLSLLKWPIIIVTIIALGFAVYLVIQNRVSEKVMLTFLPALLLASFGVLITILFGLKDEVKEVEFPALFTYERASLMPFGLARNLGYAPPSEKWASIHLEEITKAHPQVFKEE